MKVDVQGYECEVFSMVFRGMRELLASQQVRKIHFEVWAEGLAAQNCSKEQLVDTFWPMGMSYAYRAPTRLQARHQTCQ